ncbi:MAG: N-6 DNA methylase, partial [Chloroflexi bacterium]|nr:N-6 DNA methylase [Chloroflexota bacterium]
MNELIATLVAKYQQLTPQQRRRYNEAQTRHDFIDPLFEALGWDMRNIHSDDVAVETHVSGGRADYAFKLNGVTRFYLEAKPLEENLHNQEHVKQALTYAYNKGVPWAVLCSFAGLQVFNATWETTDLSYARVLNLTWQDYASTDSDLGLLSKEGFTEDKLDKHATRYGGMRPRLPVDKSLLQQLREWRERLFTQISKYRPDLTTEQVDEAIQRLLNRLIFIRTCEDRRIEEPKLRAALNRWREEGHKPGLATIVQGIFEEFDASYDSELFSFALADQVLEEAVGLDDILNGLYRPPRSLADYDFSIIDPDLLGAVYEQYLGYVAQAARERAAQQEQRPLPGMEHQAPPVHLEAKRTKRKEQGIYYTPKWVVDYIVQQTVGRLLKEKQHNDILGLKILDPACGSGSFLIRAYDELLRYHAGVRGKSVAELDQWDRLPVLTRNIFGVDLDQ